MQHDIIPDTDLRAIAQDDFHNWVAASGPLMEHQWLFFKHTIESDEYPLFTAESANVQLCLWPFDDLEDMGGNRVSKPMLFRDSTFIGSDAEEPHGNKLS